MSQKRAKAKRKQKKVILGLNKKYHSKTDSMPEFYESMPAESKLAVATIMNQVSETRKEAFILRLISPNEERGLMIIPKEKYDEDEVLSKMNKLCEQTGVLTDLIVVR